MKSETAEPANGQPIQLCSNGSAEDFSWQTLNIRRLRKVVVGSALKGNEDAIGCGG